MLSETLETQVDSTITAFAQNMLTFADNRPARAILLHQIEPQLTNERKTEPMDFLFFCVGNNGTQNNPIFIPDTYYNHQP